MVKLSECVEERLKLKEDVWSNVVDGRETH